MASFGILWQGIRAASQVLCNLVVDSVVVEATVPTSVPLLVPDLAGADVAGCVCLLARVFACVRVCLRVHPSVPTLPWRECQPAPPPYPPPRSDAPRPTPSDRALHMDMKATGVVVAVSPQDIQAYCSVLLTLMIPLLPIVRDSPHVRAVAGYLFQKIAGCAACTRFPQLAAVDFCCRWARCMSSLPCLRWSVFALPTMRMA